ncbi:MAG: DUF3565 domain-containing protein [Oceanospirillaceae bacterium]|nr:DUF3565 domain-containing protein [Oceanospirillaceae bacterium]
MYYKAYATKDHGYHTDEEIDWLAQLSCGHFQHARDTSFVNGPWVKTQQGCESMTGRLLNCKQCHLAKHT